VTFVNQSNAPCLAPSADWPEGNGGPYNSPDEQDLIARANLGAAVQSKGNLPDEMNDPVAHD
jgi:hypothetical protein